MTCMLRHTVVARGYRRTLAAHQVVRNVATSNLAIVARQQSLDVAPSSASPQTQLDPYQDYGRFLTPEGGVLIIYKDIDERLCHTLWRLFAWTAFSMVEGCYLYERSPLREPWLTIACLIIAAVINWLIVRSPVEVYRNIEIRPDCLILEGQEVFWRRFMETPPTFSPDQKGNQILGSIYGTRFVEFLTVRRFDENDRMPETFAAHFQQAVQQLWTGLY